MASGRRNVDAFSAYKEQSVHVGRVARIQRRVWRTERRRFVSLVLRQFFPRSSSFRRKIFQMWQHWPSCGRRQTLVGAYPAILPALRCRTPPVVRRIPLHSSSALPSRLFSLSLHGLSLRWLVLRTWTIERRRSPYASSASAPPLLAPSTLAFVSL